MATKDEDIKKIAGYLCNDKNKNNLKNDPANYKALFHDLMTKETLSVFYDTVVNRFEVDHIDAYLAQHLIDRPNHSGACRTVGWCEYEALKQMPTAELLMYAMFSDDESPAGKVLKDFPESVPAIKLPDTMVIKININDI